MQFFFWLGKVFGNLDIWQPAATAHTLTKVPRSKRNLKSYFIKSFQHCTRNLDPAEINGNFSVSFRVALILFFLLKYHGHVCDIPPVEDELLPSDPSNELIA